MSTYDPNTLRNLPRYVHELPAPKPGKPLPKPPVDLTGLKAKWGAKTRIGSEEVKTQPIEEEAQKACVHVVVNRERGREVRVIIHDNGKVEVEVFQITVSKKQWQWGGYNLKKYLGWAEVNYPGAKR